MKRDVLVKISGFHVTPGDEDANDPVEVITAASYYKRNGKHYVLYDEYQEDDNSLIKNRIKFDADAVEVQKEGAISTRLVFDPKQKNTTVYETPFGALSMGVTAKRIYLEEQPSKIHLDMDYILDVNLVPFVGCTLNLDVVEREIGIF